MHTQTIDVEGYREEERHYLLIKKDRLLGLVNLDFWNPIGYRNTKTQISSCWSLIEIDCTGVTYKDWSIASYI